MHNTSLERTANGRLRRPLPATQLRTLDRMDHSELLDRLGITEEDAAFFKNDNPGLCRVDTSRISSLLLAQLASVRKHRVLNSFAVTDVIQRLEGAELGGNAKAEEPFKHLPLRGFWKAHFFEPRFMMQNLVNHWGLRYESSPKFGELCARVAEAEDQDPTIHGWQGRLAHELVISGFEEKARTEKLTGEWLIFSKHKDLNYYLCIAQHSTTREGDEAIYAFLKKYCEPEYPFLFAENAF